MVPCPPFSFFSLDLSSSRPDDMSTIDSSAFFDARMTAIGLSVTEQAAIRAKGWTTLAEFAYSSAWTPGQVDDQKFIDAVVVPVLGAAGHASESKLRRLLYEAYTLSVAELKSKLTRTDSDPPVKMNMPERNARMTKLRARLAGISITESLEPSHRLVDIFVQMAEDDCIKYVPWDELTERNQEINGIVKDKEITNGYKPDAQGFMKVASESKHASADLTSDLKMKQALTRRGFAMDLAGLCDYETHQLLVELFLREFLRPPLAEHKPTSLEQIKRADRHVFTRIAEHTLAGIRPTGAGVRPVQLAIVAIMLEPTLSYLLMQTLGSKSGKGSASTDPVDKTEKKRKHEEHLASQQAAKQARLAGKKGSSKGSASPSPAAASKGKGSKGSVRLPAGLIGKSAVTADGRRKCFSFNLGGCSLAAPGDECTKGWHLCMESGCDKPHACFDHK